MSSELKMLIKYLAEERTPQRVAKANLASGFQHGRSDRPKYVEKSITSINQLSAALGYRNHSSMYPQSGQFTEESETLLRKLYGFDERTECWKRFYKFDSSGFVDAYEQLHQNADGAAYQAAYADAAEGSKKPQAQPGNVLLVKGRPRAPEPCKIKGLASVELFPVQIGRGTADIGFDISCGIARIFGVPVTIRIGEMTWDCGGGQLDPETRKGRGAPYVANNNVKLIWNGADTFRPAWRVEAADASIGDLAVPPDFGTIIGLLPGSTVTVTFGVWRPDIEEAEEADINAVIAAFEDITIPLDVNASAMSIAKKRIVARLASAAIEEDGDFIVLCRHTITFEAASTE